MQSINCDGCDALVDKMNFVKLICDGCGDFVDTVVVKINCDGLVIIAAFCEVKMLIVWSIDITELCKLKIKKLTTSYPFETVIKNPYTIGLKSAFSMR